MPPGVAPSDDEKLDTVRRICHAVSTTTLPLKLICDDVGLDVVQFRRWMHEDDARDEIFQLGLSAMYDAARVARVEVMMDETVAIADDGTNDYVEREMQNGDTRIVYDGEHVQRSKLRVDTRIQVAKMLNAKKYGVQKHEVDNKHSMSEDLVEALERARQRAEERRRERRTEDA